MGLLDIKIDDLALITPSALESILASMGWVRRGGVPEVSSQWLHEGPGGLLSVVVPLDPTFDDYPNRVWEAIRKIAAVYPYGEDSLLFELTMPGVDEITSRKDVPTIRGTIPWKAAEDQIVGFRKTLTAGAKAAERRQRHFGHSNRKAAQDFMAQLRMGQTRVGSFIVTALSPIGPLPTKDKGSQYDDQIGGLTGRRVLESVDQSLKALLSASDEFVQRGNANVFDETLREGVSLDLVGGVKQNLGEAAGSETTISWTPLMSHSDREGAQSRVVFESKHVPALRSAIKRFKEIDADSQVNIVGVVTGLEREAPGEPGRIVVRVIDGSDANYVKVELSERYNDAVESHKDGNLIRIVGTQERVGTQHIIRDPDELFRIDSHGETPTLNI
ncbi:hypothetical protein RHOER0001_4355 [Rhodococcus erythropolis SK121]|nr:hypothetical protein RHOER0001_4355 [Rhodococcus erythropolis SK121]